MSWQDEEDEYTPAIKAAHPTRSDDPKRHERYLRALQMVENRHSKYALVDLANWLLMRAETPKESQ